MAAAREVDVLLVGGGVASVRCARTLRRRGFTGSVLLVGEEPHAPYNRPPLSKQLLNAELPLELVAAEAPTWYERHAVELRAGLAVAAIDASNRMATMADGLRVRYGNCLLATGAAPRHPSVPGAEHALLLRSFDDALEIRRRATRGGRAVVIGGGFIGAEVAGSLEAWGMEVTVLELAPSLWGGSLGVELSAWASGALASAGVQVRASTAVTRLDPDAAWIGDERLPADVLVAGVGVTPRDELAGSAGLACQDGVLADATHATSAPGIFAAGDAARVDGRRVEHWHAAREGGERAALAMLGEPLPPPRAPWVFSEFAGQLLDVVGFAPTWDETRVLGDPSADHFVVAYLHDGVVAQLAVTNSAVPTEQARAFVEGRPSSAALRDLPI